MDKKNTVIGILLLMAAFTLLVLQQPPPDERERPAPEPVEEQPEPAAPDFPDPAPEDPLAEPEAPVDGPEAVQPLAEEDEEIVILRNPYFDVELTNRGGAINVARLEEYERTKGSEERYQMNEFSEYPALSLIDVDGVSPLAGYEVVSRTDTEVRFHLRVDERLEIERRYSITPDAEGRDPHAYIVRHETIFRNLTGQDLLFDEFGINLGTAAPTGGRTLGIEHLNFGHYDGNRFRHLAPRRFDGGGFLSWIGVRSGAPVPYIQEEVPLVWASVKNQFFTSIFTPDQTPSGFFARPVELPEGVPENEREERGITGNVLFDLRGIPADGEQVVSADFYTGPKEYRRLEALEQNQDRVMQFGPRFIAFISQLLLSMMVAIYSVVPNYGLSIIIVTIIIKTLLWPLTAKAAHSSKRMAKIAEPMKALREKYKDDPKKMQAETMKLFRENRVNPLGGCLPMLVQIPIFFGLFRMIMSASELRYAEFLWITDLSQPDTVATIFGLPLNLLPFAMTASMYFQMKMMPMAVDNTQAKIFRMMPFIFFFFCYMFSSGLVLYWTVQNLLTILQQYLTNRKRDDDEPVTATAAAGGSGGEAAAEPIQVSPYLKKKKKKKKKTEQ